LLIETIKKNKAMNKQSTFTITKNGRLSFQGLSHKEAILKLAILANDAAGQTSYYHTDENYSIVDPDSKRTIFEMGDESATIGNDVFAIAEEELTYDIYFHSNEYSANKGFKYSLEAAKNYIEIHNGTNHSYFQDFKGGMVQILCNETEQVVFEVEIL
jgi:hypothetical protein